MDSKDLKQKICTIDFIKDSKSHSQVKLLALPDLRKVLSYVMIIVIEIVLFIGLTAYLSSIKSRVKKSLTIAERNVNMRGVPKNIHVIERKMKVVKKLVEMRKLQMNVLTGITNNLPDGVWLVELTLNSDGTGTVKGESFTADAVMTYVSRITKIKGIKAVTFKNGGLKKDKNGVYKFTLNIVETWHRKKRRIK